MTPPERTTPAMTWTGAVSAAARERAPRAPGAVAVAVLTLRPAVPLSTRAVTVNVVLVGALLGAGLHALLFAREPTRIDPAESAVAADAAMSSV